MGVLHYCLHRNNDLLHVLEGGNVEAYKGILIQNVRHVDMIPGQNTLQILPWRSLMDSQCMYNRERTTNKPMWLCLFFQKFDGMFSYKDKCAQIELKLGGRN